MYKRQGQGLTAQVVVQVLILTIVYGLGGKAFPEPCLQMLTGCPSSVSYTHLNRVTEEEIKAIVKEGFDGGEVQEVEQDIVERVFNLGDPIQSYQDRGGW